MSMPLVESAYAKKAASEGADGFVGAHPLTGDIENELRKSRATLRARETRKKESI